MPDVPAVPVVHTRLTWRDALGTLRARLGIARDAYAVTPGLYAVGTPEPDSPVLVTANYKLTFDAVRSQLTGRNLWLLVLDTRGINVWCAAGKELFSTKELVQKIRRTRLDEVVRHRTLILPQLAAPGVSAVAVRRATGFRVCFGPVRAEDLPAFLDAAAPSAGAAVPELEVSVPEEARTVTFTLRERAVLIPVELTLRIRYFAALLLVAFVLNGLTGPGAFWENTPRFWAFAAFTLGGVVAGNVAVPVFLPWIPGRMFGAKGALLGLATGAGVWLGVSGLLSGWAGLGGVLWCAALASFLATSFTGSTPFTSPSGVEKELKRWLPLQAVGAVAGWILWLCA